ncbi:DUF5819 family protein [Streptomyces acidiscabies]|uniref:DUF5819 family protein n=1 Tax=Streptomyces acidiscabies TaxID=42234 RepID=UPI00073E27CB|nr:DUF5819 family protein [Streptomyces acidiscabies]GAQ53788.1 hypothetical protein a10_03593 [Streptomyces acidiscabies]
MNTRDDASRGPQEDPKPHAPREGADGTESVGSAEETDDATPDRDALDLESPDADTSPPDAPDSESPTRLTALSLRAQITVAGVVALVAAVALVHIGMVFLHIAPSNTVSKQHARAVDDWVYPEFEQNWKLFAPNPLQQDIAVQVRAEVRSGDGGYRTTGWFDLSAADGRAIDGNLLPSHTQQNELRRAWDFFTGTHDNDNRAVGMRGALSEEYLRRIIVMRLERGGTVAEGGTLARVQVRSRTSNVAPPKWSDEKVSTQPTFRVLPWWRVPAAEANGGVK